MTPPSGVQYMTVPQLNQVVMGAGDLQEKLNAMEELAMRNDADPGTFQALQQQIATNTAHLTGAERMNAVDAKRAAILSLSLLNGRMNPNTPTAQLPGFNEMVKAFNSRTESPEVKKAVLQGLRAMNRPNDPAVKKLARAASRDKDPQMKQLAQALLKGQPVAFAASDLSL